MMVGVAALVDASPSIRWGASDLSAVECLGVRQYD
jgi:hypothetical protein